MNRRAVVGFLVLAGLVGGVQALDESVLVSLGDRLFALQGAIAADTAYTRLTASPGYLWGGDVVNTYDPYQGPQVDYGGIYYVDSTPSYQTYEPLYQVVKNDDGGILPSGFVPISSYAEYGTSVGSAYSYGGYDNLLVEYPSMYGDVYGSVSAANYVGSSIDPYGEYYTGSSLSYGRPVYQDTWYTQAFPGIGQALVPLIPPQYQPVGYGTTGYSIVAAQPYPSGYGSQQYYPQQTPRPSAAPTCSISLSPSDIRYGGSTVISWVSRDATSASLNDIGAVPLSGSKTIHNQTTSRTIGLTVARHGRIGACYALLEVAPDSLVRPYCIISVYPERIQRGQSASIAWLANNSTAASLSGVGSVAREGGRTVSPTETSTYVLTVGDGSRSSMCSATLQVL